MDLAIKRIQQSLGVDRVAAGMTFAASGAAKWQEGLRRLSEQAGSTGGHVDRLRIVAEGSGTGFRKAQTALTNLGLGMVGLRGPTGKLAEGLLMLGLGGPVMLGVVGGLAAIGFAYHKLTEQTRKLKEEVEKFAEAQLKAAATRRNPFAELDEGATKTRLRIVQLQNQLATLRERSAAAGRGGDVLFGKGIENTVNEIERLSGVLRAADAARAESGQKLVNSLRTQLALYGLSAEAAQRAAIAASVASERDVPAANEAIALLNLIEKKRLETEAREKHLKALRAEREEYMRLLEAMTRAKFDALQAPVLELKLPTTQGARTVDQIRQAQRENRAFIEKMIGFDPTGKPDDMDVFRRKLGVPDMAPVKEAADLYRQTWKNAIEGVQRSFADFFSNLFEEGTSLVTFFRNAARAIQSAFANLLAQQTTNWLGTILKFGASVAGGGSGIPSAPTDTIAVGPVLSQRAAPASEPIIIAPQFYVSSLGTADAAAALMQMSPVVTAAVVRGVETSAFARRALQGR